MMYDMIREGPFRYLDIKGKGDTLLLLHGLFGHMSNFEKIIQDFGGKYRVVVPLLPIFELPLKNATIRGLLDHVDAFVKYKEYKRIHLVGNSLGGHLALMYALRAQERIESIILTGSSGLFESAFGGGILKRRNYDFIKQKTESTFYDPNFATKEMVDEVFESVNDRNKGLRLVKTAKSAIRHNLQEALHQIKVPTLLVWGKEDKITPLFVGKKFNELIKNSRLVEIEECGHAPMMERPGRFNRIMADFLSGLHLSKGIIGKHK